jgi:aspartyl-tRNA(Asn)/glutamyl-tRNA(Gln) amidotransferase subunit C
MPKHITSEDVDTVSALARLDLTAREKKRTILELESILTYIDRLSAINTSTVEPYESMPVLLPLLRKDVAHPFVDREALLSKDRFKDNLLVTKGVFSRKSKEKEDES